MSFKINTYNITLKVKSGLYIGAANTELKIGGVDNEFIKHSSTGQPYIPGSSLKGKMRSLLEYDAGILSFRNSSDNNYGSVLSISDVELAKRSGKDKAVENILRLFGTAAGSESNPYGVTRLSFSDLELSEDYKGKNVFEVKAETAIDRAEGNAKNGSLRFTERVGAGVEFEGTISLKVFDKDNEKELEETFLKGIRYIMLDALGGSASRGYGRVEISFEDEAVNKKLSEIDLSK